MYLDLLPTCPETVLYANLSNKLASISMLSSAHITELYILEKVLAEIPDEKIPHKTYKGYMKNILEILYELNLRHRETVSDIFRFSVVYFKC